MLGRGTALGTLGYGTYGTGPFTGGGGGYGGGGTSPAPTVAVTNNYAAPGQTAPAPATVPGAGQVTTPIPTYIPVTPSPFATPIPTQIPVTPSPFATPIPTYIPVTPPVITPIPTHITVTPSPFGTATPAATTPMRSAGGGGGGPSAGSGARAGGGGSSGGGATQPQTQPRTQPLVSFGVTATPVAATPHSTLTPAQVSLLEGAGYTPAQIAAMSPAQQTALANQVATSLTPAQKAQLTGYTPAQWATMTPGEQQTALQHSGIVSGGGLASIPPMVWILGGVLLLFMLSNGGSRTRTERYENA